MKHVLLVLSLILPFGPAIAQDVDEQAARQKAEYDFAYATALNAAVYGWAPLIMDVSKELQTSVDAPTDSGQAPINHFGPISRLWDYWDRSYATLNNDTLHLQAWVDVEEQPVVIWIPPIENRFWIEQVLAPTGPFSVIMRLYWPKEAALDGTWTAPPLNKVN